METQMDTCNRQLDTQTGDFYMFVECEGRERGAGGEGGRESRRKPSLTVVPSGTTWVPSSPAGLTQDGCPSPHPETCGAGRDHHL